MKDKSRLLSSVIVSLLAGFIYYQFGDNIQEKFQTSIKAVLSSNDINIPSECESFNTLITKTSGDKVKKKKSKFYVKKKSTIEFKTKDVTVPGDEIFSTFISQNQAKFDRPVADKNVDFTAELDRLVKNDLSKTNQPGRKLKITRSSSNNEIANNNSSKTRIFKINKNLDKTTGNGFEYNFVTEDKLAPTTFTPPAFVPPAKSTDKVETKCNSKTKCKKNKVEYNYDGIDGKNFKVIVPKEKVKFDDEDIDVDDEINIQDETDAEDNM